MRLDHKQWFALGSALLLLLGVLSVVIYMLTAHTDFQPKDQSVTIETRTSSIPTPTPTPHPPGKPFLEKLQVVTNQAFGNEGDYVPNSWGMQKSRIVRTSTGDLFTVYISAGTGLQDRQFHLMHKAPNSNSWEDIFQGDAGAEPINILLGPNDAIHLFAWPGLQRKLQHFISTNLGKSFQSEFIPGQWSDQQGYSSGGINDKGDIVFFQTGVDQPGTFLWTYFSPTTNQWQFHTSTFDYRYTYAYFIPGENNDLTMVGMRDVQRELLGYAPNNDFDYIFNSIKYFHIGDVNHPNSTFTQLEVAKAQPQNDQDYDITYLTDTYIDTQSRTHILYNNQYDGAHQVIVQNGQIVKNVPMDISLGKKMRMTQDAEGRFYIIAVDNQKHLNIYAGATKDTDGTQLDPVVHLNASPSPGCFDDDYCHLPTFTEPRSGNALSDTIDGVYGNFANVVYFKVNLRGVASSSMITPHSPHTLLASLLLSMSAFIQDEKKRFWLTS